MVTVAESITAKIKKARDWEQANPGRSWVSPEYPEDLPKIYIHKNVLESEVYRSLSRVALLVYLIDFLSKRVQVTVRRNGKKIWVIANNGSIQYPYSEAESKGISRTKFRNAIDELQQKGFIDITHRGVGGRKPADGTGDSTTYFIDDRWEKYETAEFQTPRKPRQKDSRQDRGWQDHWKQVRATAWILFIKTRYAEKIKVSKTIPVNLNGVSKTIPVRQKKNETK